MSFWADLQRAFDEGRDEIQLGAPPEHLIDAMTLAARVDQRVTDDELRRMVTLLRRHFHAFHDASDAQIMNTLSDSVSRLRTHGDQEAQARALSQAIRGYGTEGTETAYALAFAVLVENGLSAIERAFSDAFRVLLAIEEERAQAIEAELLAALGPGAP